MVFLKNDPRSSIPPGFERLLLRPVKDGDHTSYRKSDITSQSSPVGAQRPGLAFQDDNLNVVTRCCTSWNNKANVVWARNHRVSLCLECSNMADALAVKVHGIPTQQVLNNGSSRNGNLPLIAQDGPGHGLTQLEHWTTGVRRGKRASGSAIIGISFSPQPSHATHNHDSMVETTSSAALPTAGPTTVATSAPAPAPTIPHAMPTPVSGPPQRASPI